MRETHALEDKTEGTKHQHPSTREIPKIKLQSGVAQNQFGIGA